MNESRAGNGKFLLFPALLFMQFAKNERFGFEDCEMLAFAGAI